MKILVLNYEFPPLGGGAAPVSYEIAKGYVKQGHNVSVVTTGFQDLPLKQEIGCMTIYRMKCRRAKKETCSPIEQASYLIAARRFLKNHLKHNSYDICHTHFIIPTGVLALWLNKKYHLPYIITAHGSDVPGFNPDRFTLLHKFTKPLLRKICSGAKSITAPSQYLADLIEEKIGKYDVTVIPNGAQNFAQTTSKKTKSIVTCGRLLPRKGFQLIINTFKKIKKPEWKLYIIGEGPYRADLEQLARSDNRIIFTGWLNNKEQAFRTILNQATIFSLLSSSESQGIVYIEAMSCSCAILAPDSTACKETVDKTCGYLVDLSKEEIIEQKLRHLMDDIDKTITMGKNARKRYEHMFEYTKIIPKYEKLL